MSNFLIMKTKLFSIKIKLIEHFSSSRHSSIAIENFLKSKQIYQLSKPKLKFKVPRWYLTTHYDPMLLFHASKHTIYCNYDNIKPSTTKYKLNEYMEKCAHISFHGNTKCNSSSKLTILFTIVPPLPIKFSYSKLF